jgi:hypothetical protein
MGGIKVYKSLVRNPEGKRPLVRPRHRKEGNTKMDVKEIGCDDMDWIPIRLESSCWFMCIW